MEKLFFMGRLMDVLSQGGFFRKVFAITLKIFAVLSGVFGVVLWVTIWSTINNFHGFGVIALIVFQFIFAVVCYMIVHDMIIRAKDIDSLADSPYTIMEIMTIFLKLFGEIVACFCALFSIGGSLMTWFAGSAFPLLNYSDPFSQGYGANTSGSFLSGLMILVFPLIIGFFFLVFSYFASELIIVVADIAANTKKLQTTAENYWKYNSNQGISNPPPFPKQVAFNVCKNCGVSFAKGLKYCPKCGFEISH